LLAAFANGFYLLSDRFEENLNVSDQIYAPGRESRRKERRILRRQNSLEKDHGQKDRLKYTGGESV